MASRDLGGSTPLRMVTVQGCSMGVSTQVSLTVLGYVTVALPTFLAVPPRIRHRCQMNPALVPGFPSGSLRCFLLGSPEHSKAKTPLVLKTFLLLRQPLLFAPLTLSLWKMESTSFGTWSWKYSSLNLYSLNERFPANLDSLWCHPNRVISNIILSHFPSSRVPDLSSSKLIKELALLLSWGILDLLFFPDFSFRKERRTPTESVFG